MATVFRIFGHHEEGVKTLYTNIVCARASQIILLVHRSYRWSSKDMAHWANVIYHSRAVNCSEGPLS